MAPELRRSLPTRLVAIAFIAMILLGNYWLVERLLGQPAPGWLSASFALAILTAGVGGCGMMFVAWKLGRSQPSEAEDEQ